MDVTISNPRATHGRRIYLLLLLAAGLGAYANSLQGPFLLDDVVAIAKNPHLRAFWPPWSSWAGTSRPMVQWTLALNYAIGGLRVAGYHALNLVIHLLAGWTLFGIVRRLLRQERCRDRYGAAADSLAFAVALVWLLHPLQTESVTYLIQRGESLMGLFFLATLYCVLRGAESPRPRGWCAGAVLACALGMATKPAMAVAPLVVLGCDRIFLARSFRELARARWGLYAGLALTWLVLAGCLANGPKDWHATAGFGQGAVSVREYAASQPGVIAHYLRLAVWPDRLCLDYAWPVARSAAAIVPGAAVVLLLLAGTVWALRARPAAGFLGLWFFLILAPSSSFIPIADLAFEHRMYLPLAAVAALLVIGGWMVLTEVCRRRDWRPAAGRWAAIVFVAGIAVVLGIRTFRRNARYQSAVSIWQDTVTQRPNNARARACLGDALQAGGRFDQAMAQYAASLRLKPGNALVHNNWGMALAERGDWAGAIAHFRRALQTTPDDPAAQCNLGFALCQQGRVAEGISALTAAVRQHADLELGHYYLGVVLVQQGRLPEGIAQFQEALRIDPDSVLAHYHLGQALSRTGRLEPARAHLAEAVRLKPDYAKAHCSLGLVLGKLGRLEQATAQFEEAVRIDPALAEAHYNLGVAWARQGRIDRARQCLADVLALHPNDAAARRALADLTATNGPPLPAK